MSETEALILSELREIKAMIAPQTKRPGLTNKAAAERLGVSVWTINRWVKAGKLRKEKGRIPNAVVEAMLS